MSSNPVQHRIQPPSNSPSYRAATTRLAEPFWDVVEQVFEQIDGLIGNRAIYEEGDAPTSDNVDWAKEVLLRCGLPRYYLSGVEIDVFHGEIHVTWENQTKRVVAFLPAPQQLKIYHETIHDGNVASHELHSGQTPTDLRDRLGWFFSK